MQRNLFLIGYSIKHYKYFIVDSAIITLDTCYDKYQEFEKCVRENNDNENPNVHLFISTESKLAVYVNSQVIMNVKNKEHSNIENIVKSIDIAELNLINVVKNICEDDYSKERITNFIMNIGKNEIGIIVRGSTDFPHLKK